MVVWKRFVMLLALAVGAAACASSPGPQAGTPRGSANLITEAELAQYGAQPVRQAIQRLRPNMLRTRGTSSINQRSADVIVVYMGTTRMGSLEVLDQITTNDVREVRYLDAADASQRYGIGHTSGAIVLVPKT